jgi:FAD-dependent sensor of blue light
MTSDLHRLVYYSHNHILGGPTEVEVEVHKILEQSRRNNSLVGVTGTLIFNSGIFAQVLEGARADLESTFERIQRDERHGDVQVLSFGAVQSRSFASWSMAFVGRSREGQQLFAHIGEETGFDVKRMEAARIFGIMHDITIEEEARVA